MTTETANCDVLVMKNQIAELRMVLRMTAKAIDLLRERLLQAVDQLEDGSEASVVEDLRTPLRLIVDELQRVAGASAEPACVDEVSVGYREAHLLARFADHFDQSFSQNEALIRQTLRDEATFRPQAADYEDALDYFEGFLWHLLHVPSGGQHHLIRRWVKVLLSEVLRLAQRRGRNIAQVAYETAIHLGFNGERRDCGLH